MREAGWFLIAIGVLALIGGFFVDVTRHVGYIPSSPYLPSMPSEVANIHAMHIQALIFQGGFAAFISGIIALCFGTVDETLKSNAPPPPVTPAPTPAPQPVEAPVAEEPENETVNMTALVLGLVAVALIVIMILAYSQSQTGRAAHDLNDVNSAGNATLDAMNDLNDAARDAEEAANQAARAADEAERAARRGVR